VGMASTDLNATLLAWPPGHEVAEHVNAELDVLVIVLDGHGSATIDGESHDLAGRAARFSSRTEHAGASQPMKLACATSQSTGAADHCKSRRHRTADELNAP
jgi:hypothetical protein